MNQATLIGFGEAGQAFAANGGWRAFDIVPEKSLTSSLAEALTLYSATSEAAQAMNAENYIGLHL